MTHHGKRTLFKQNTNSTFDKYYPCPTPSPPTHNSPVDLYDKFYWPIDQSIYTCPLLPTQNVTLCSKEGCMWVLALFVFFFRNEISKPQFLVFNSKGALWNLRSLTNQPYWWFYCLLHLTLWCKILKNLCSSVKIERPLIQLHIRNNEMKWKTLTIRVYNVLLVPVILL